MRRSCLGALVSVLDEKSCGPVHGHAFPAFACAGLRAFTLARAVERAARHGAHEVAPIIGACVDVLKRVDRRRRPLRRPRAKASGPGGWPASAASASAIRRGVRLGAADADARLGDRAVREPIGHERHARARSRRRGGLNS